MESVIASAVTSVRTRCEHHVSAIVSIIASIHGDNNDRKMSTRASRDYEPHCSPSNWYLQLMEPGSTIQVKQHLIILSHDITGRAMVNIPEPIHEPEDLHPPSIPAPGGIDADLQRVCGPEPVI